MASPAKLLFVEERSVEMSDAEMEAHLNAYMTAFLGTEQEFIREFEEVGVACWLNADRPDKR
jgi:hypothetical protein